MTAQALGRKIEQLRQQSRMFPACTVIILVYTAVLAAFSGLIITLNWSETLLFLFLIPCLLGAFLFRRRQYLAMQILLAGSAVWVTSRVSESFQSSLLNIGMLLICMVAASEVVHLLSDTYIRQSLELRHSEQRYRDLFEKVPLGMYRTTPQGEITEVNNALVEILGYPDRETLLQVNASDLFVDPADEEEWAEQIAAEGLVRGFETRLRRWDGSIIWVKDDTRALFDGQDAVVAYQGSIENISKRKEHEKRIAFQSHLLDQIEDKITATDLEGKITYVNQAVARDLGLAPEDLIGSHVEEYGEDPDYGATQQEIVEQTLQSGKWRGEVVNYSREVERLVLDSRTQLIENDQGEPIGMLGVSTDITERVKAEQETQSQRQRLASIIEGTHVGTWEWNVQTGETIFNDIWAEIVGYSLEELEPITIDTWLNLVHPEDQEVSSRLLQEHFRGELDQYSIEARMRHKKGHWVWVLDRGRVIEWTETGEPLWMFGTHTDITERKRVESQLKEYSERLEEMVQERTRELREAQEKAVRQERLAVMGELAGSVAHELRNPLAVIMNSVYYLTMSLEDADEKIQEYLDYIEEETRSANKIITELLDFARETDQHRGRVSLAPLIKQVLTQQLVPEGVNCQLDLPDDLPDLLVDPDQIKQVLVNLVSNACHALPEGGELRISAFSQALSGSPGVAVEVADTGVGIPPENLQKIFDPLFTTRSRGIGLGLAISQKLVEANQGEISVTSEEGKGTRFRVALPAAFADPGEGSSVEGG